MLKHSSMTHETTVSEACADGKHRPQRGSEYLDGFSRRATCRGCRCTLLRVDTTRRWIRSGVLG